ncbi:mitochondrial processing peptidase [Saccharomycopsis crataegensis]|uniref:mitochondrial processing peptidase n=1 Tax=Saccharomycopsis crataegensis TaxID=43959 RepID=A0AAV5QP10_9ASCO|nr:mitochondrial processing peptidase [Saccharomycopsis crataegensis]
MLNSKFMGVSAKRLATRGFASVSSSLPKTQISKLSNGLTVVSENIPFTSTATVGVWIDSGSRAETTKNNGTAHFLEHLSFKGTKNRTQTGLELEIENIGSHLNAYTSRETTVYYAKTLQKNIPNSIEILSDILTHSVLDPRAIERERDVIIRESEEVDKMYDEVVFDHLHSVAFKDQPLGMTILGPRENILSIQRNDLVDYINENYKGDRMALIGTGAVDHAKLCEFAENSFGHLSKTKSRENMFGETPHYDLPVFKSSEMKVEDASVPQTHIAISVEGVSWSSPEYFTSLVVQAMIGTWDRSMGNGLNNPSKLVNTVAYAGVNNTPIANSFMSFSTSYSDTGLWGIYLTTDSSNNEKLIQGILDEWKRLKKGEFAVEELEKAKNQLKASLLLSLDGTTAVAEDIGRQIVSTGKRLTPEEVFDAVNRVNKDDIVNWCNYRLGAGKISLAALGAVSDIPSYQQISQQMV